MTRAAPRGNFSLEYVIGVGLAGVSSYLAFKALGQEIHRSIASTAIYVLRLF